ncbi:P63C domain-containing protein [Methylobacterium fujisawaense]|uniref:P63C domain-containing protein n=1 Tax=Methylobacterium fujisawaense TaxID=107400 RepID=UPI003CF59336
MRRDQQPKDESSQSRAGKARLTKMTPEERREVARAGAAARWAKADPERASLPRAEFGDDNRPLQINGMSIPCFVLEDERRVLTFSGMQDALNMAKGGSMVPGMNRFELFASRDRIKPFISNELMERIRKPIVFISPSGGRAYGYEAEVLVEICEAVLAARSSETGLQKQQMQIAHQCELIMRGLARVGIVALVDEATGYQLVRKRDALAKILEAYISKELLPWAQRFPLEFYEEIYRLHRWDDLDPAGKSKPGYVGMLTNALVYERLPTGVLEQLRTQNPKDLDGNRKFKHHQFLTEDIGNPHLEKHLAKVVGLMQASDTWAEFKRMFRRVFKVPENEPSRGRGSMRI